VGKEETLILNVFNEQWEFRKLIVKVKVKFTLEQAAKPQRGSRGIALLFLQLRRKMGVGGQHHAPAVLPP
jgi:hypothetical protein